MALTKQNILDFFYKFLSIKNPRADLTTGTVVRDMGVEATAEVLAEISSENDNIKGMVSLNPDYFTDEQADQYAQNYEVYRKGPQKASGDISFGAITVPAEGSPVVIPVGTVVMGQVSETSAPISFVTTTEGIISSTSPYNANTGYYETVAGIEAVVPGTSSNMGIGYINQLQTTINGVTAVYNKNAIVNGTDTETTESLLERVNLKRNGRNTNTGPGLLAWIYENPKVKQAIVVGPDSEYSIRGPGAVDIYVLGEMLVQYTQTVTEMTKEVLLTQTPVSDPNSSIYVTVNGVTYHESDNVFAYVKDTSTVWMSSYKAKDKIVWTDVGFDIIKNATSYTITYSYNGLIIELQNTVMDNNTRLITGDVLIRDTIQVGVVMEFGISILNGFDKNTVISEIKSNIQSYVNNLTLNSDLRQSDIINIVENTNGVDYVILPMLQFHRIGETDPSKQVADIISSPLEYFRVDADNIIIG